jgi:periplasmic protein TonB
MYSRRNRALNYAILFSLALHGLLLFGLPGLRDAAKRAALIPAPIVARLVEPAPPAAPEPIQPPPQPQPPRAKPRPAPKPLAKAEPLLQPESAAPAEQPAASEPEPAAATAATAEAQPSGPVASVAPSAEPDPGSLARFRLEIISLAGRFKRYPRVAIDNNWEGTAEVRLTFAADGRRSSIVIVKSSGHEVLDKQALDTIGRAFVPVPPALRGKEFSLEIPVIYNLKDAPSG